MESRGEDFVSLSGWMMTRVNGRAWEKKFLVLADFDLSAWKSELMREEDSVSPHRLDLQSLECLSIEMDHGKARKNIDSVCLLISQHFKIQCYHSDDAEETRVWFHILDFIIFGRVATQQQLGDLSEDAQERILAVQGFGGGCGVDVVGGGWWVGGLQVIIVSVHVLYFSFTPIYVGQEGLLGTQVYASLRRFTSVGRDVELDNMNFVLPKLQRVTLKSLSLG